jgi:hypothetical protein
MPSPITSTTDIEIADQPPEQRRDEILRRGRALVAAQDLRIGEGDRCLCEVRHRRMRPPGHLGEPEQIEQGRRRRIGRVTKIVELRHRDLPDPGIDQRRGHPQRHARGGDVAGIALDRREFRGGGGEFEIERQPDQRGLAGTDEIDRQQEPRLCGVNARPGPADADETGADRALADAELE